MATYKGIPFNGGMNSPSGTGAQHIVETIKAIIDYLVSCTTPGRLLDTLDAPSVEWLSRIVLAANGTTTLDWENAGLYSYVDASLVMDWAHRTTYDDTARKSLDWQQRQLLTSDGTTPILSWAGGNVVTALPNLDPGISGALWNNGGVVAVSP